ncbi:MAG: ABC transporter permease [Betaproteobacteria bacterium]|nr:ABC transporter permease [Betaproteobacteria bacterium]
MLERAMPWLVLLGSLAIWEAGCLLFAVPKFILPSPSAIATSAWQWHEQLGLHAAQTFYTTVVGFSLAVAGGMVLGVGIGASRLLYKGLYPILIGFNSVPKVAVVPVLVIWFGIGSVPAIITAFLLAFFPIVVNVATGLATIEPEVEDVLRSLGASKWDILVKVGIPGSLPYFFASLKIAITLALVGSVVSETIGSNTGIGYLMLSASSQFNVPLVFAGLVVVAVMGVLIYAVFATVEHRFTYWATRKLDYAAGS